MGVTFINKNGAPLTTNIPHSYPNYPPGRSHQGKRFEENPHPIPKYPGRVNGISPPVHWREEKPGLGHLPGAKSARQVAKKLANNPHEIGFYNALALRSYFNGKNIDDTLAKVWKTTANPYAQEVLEEIAVEELNGRMKQEEQENASVSKGGSYIDRRRKSRRISKRKANRRTSKK